jgi:ABC-2 type transport system permease protein
MAAEVLKQHRILFGTRFIYFSLLVWPGVNLATAYYGFKPFLGAAGLAQRWPSVSDPRTLFLFFTTGMLGYTFFWSLVQAAWQFSWERFHGTLELVFLSPASRMALVLANGAGALVQSTWLFLAFACGLTALVGGLNLAHPGMLVVAFVGLLVPAVAWGAFLNSLFIFSRDSGFLYTILDEPMALLSGVRIPPQALPALARAAGMAFPLSTSLIVLRGALLEARTLSDLWPRLLFLLALSAVLVGLAAMLLRWGEAHAKRSGSLTLF